LRKGPIIFDQPFRRKIMKALLLAPALCALLQAQIADPMDAALKDVNAELTKQPGHALVLVIERVDVFTVKLRVKTVNAPFQVVEAQARINGVNAGSVFSLYGKDLDGATGTVRVNEEANELFLTLAGADFYPKLVAKLPRRDEKPEVVKVVTSSSPVAPSKK
jgi:hypothetical protein